MAESDICIINQLFRSLSHSFSMTLLLHCRIVKMKDAVGISLPTSPSNKSKGC